MKRVGYIILTLIAIAGCNRDESHIDANHDKAAVAIEFDVSGIKDTKFSDANIYFLQRSQAARSRASALTDMLKVTHYEYFKSVPELSKKVMFIAPGTYTILTVLNVNASYPPH